MNHLALNDGHPGAIKFARHEFATELCVDLIDDLKHLRQNGLKEIDILFFQCFRHDGVVCVGEGARRNVKRAIKGNVFFHEQADEFRYTHGRMRVVKLNSNVLGKAVNRSILAFKPQEDIL